MVWPSKQTQGASPACCEEHGATPGLSPAALYGGPGPSSSTCTLLYFKGFGVRQGELWAQNPSDACTRCTVAGCLTAPRPVHLLPTSPERQQQTAHSLEPCQHVGDQGGVPGS